jgi:hypothetical protein
VDHRYRSSRFNCGIKKYNQRAIIGVACPHEVYAGMLEITKKAL